MVGPIAVTIIWHIALLVILISAIRLSIRLENDQLRSTKKQESQLVIEMARLRRQNADLLEKLGERVDENRSLKTRLDSVTLMNTLSKIGGGDD